MRRAVNGRFVSANQRSCDDGIRLRQARSRLIKIGIQSPLLQQTSWRADRCLQHLPDTPILIWNTNIGSNKYKQQIRFGLNRRLQGWGDAMVLIALLSFLIGALLALRWKVLVLLAAVGAALPLVAVIGSARGDDAGSLALDMLVAVTFIEAGYIARLVAYVFVDAAGAVVRTVILDRGAERLTVLPGSARAGIAPRGRNAL